MNRFIISNDQRSNKSIVSAAGATVWATLGGCTTGISGLLWMGNPIGFCFSSSEAEDFWEGSFFTAGWGFSYSSTTSSSNTIF